MEFVEGNTLSKWLRDEKRGWREVVSVFRQAGEGLAAAHAAGLVHRDFKPDNVLVGADGRVRVTDFGLARAQGPALAGLPATPGPATALDTSLTATGALVGTPAYMAPEQLVPQGRADALSDQFAYCVAFFEALFGQRPFRASDVESLSSVIREGRIGEAPRARGVPRWLNRIVVRGLSLDPQERWASMRALLTALSRGPKVTPARLLVLAVALGTIALLLWISRPLCNGAEAAWGSLWNTEEQEAVQRAVQKTGRPAAAIAFANLQSALDRFRAAWIAMHREACLATHLRREQSEGLLDLRMVCLANQRRRAEALVRAFAQADGALVDSAPAVLEALPSLEPCANATALLASTPLPADPVKRARISVLEGRLAEIFVLTTAPGKSKAALDAVGPALAESRQLGDLSLAARLLVQRARLEMSTDSEARARDLARSGGSGARRQG